MRTLLFLSRVCVLLNVMFIVYVAGYFHWLPLENNYLKGLIITTGYGIAFLFNLVLQPVLFVLLLTRRGSVVITPWIIIFNFFCFILQLFFFFFT